jgi:hypothetical protein
MTTIETAGTELEEMFEDLDSAEDTVSELIDVLRSSPESAALKRCEDLVFDLQDRLMTRVLRGYEVGALEYKQHLEHVGRV